MGTRRLPNGVEPGRQSPVLVSDSDSDLVVATLTDGMDAPVHPNVHHHPSPFAPSNPRVAASPLENCLSASPCRRWKSSGPRRRWVGLPSDAALPGGQPQPRNPMAPDPLCRSVHMGAPSPALQEAGGNRQEQMILRKGKDRREWEDMILRHGHWGRDRLAFATPLPPTGQPETARGETPGPSVPNDPRPEWARGPGAISQPPVFPAPLRLCGKPSPHTCSAPAEPTRPPRAHSITVRVRAGRSKWNSWSTGPEGRPGQSEDG